MPFPCTNAGLMGRPGIRLSLVAAFASGVRTPASVGAVAGDFFVGASMNFFNFSGATSIGSDGGATYHYKKLVSGDLGNNIAITTAGAGLIIRGNITTAARKTTTNLPGSPITVTGYTKAANHMATVMFAWNIDPGFNATPGNDFTLGARDTADPNYRLIVWHRLTPLYANQNFTGVTQVNVTGNSMFQPIELLV